MDTHENKNNIDLFEAILLLRNVQECEIFFKDLCTPQELTALKERWKVCQILESKNMSYREIHGAIGVSLATIGRVARFLREESYGGYRLILQRLNETFSMPTKKEIEKSR